MSVRHLLVAVLVAAGSAAVADDDPQKAAEEYQKQQAKLLAEIGKAATHQQAAEIKVAGVEKGHTLQTLAVDQNGRVVALVAKARGYGAPVPGATGEVHVFAPDGKPVKNWRVPFHAHSINVGPDNTIYVAGDAQVAKFAPDGKPVGDPVELAHVTDLLKDQDAFKTKAAARLEKEKKQMGESMKEAKKQFEERIKKIEDKKEADRTKTEVRQLEQAKQILKSYDQSAEFYEKRTVEDVMKETIGRLRIINGIAVSDTDVFVACGETEGFGYGVWRMDRDLKNPKKVLGEIGGCCGQMDIQVQGPDLLVAENTKHQFARYSRDGKKLGSYGKRGQDTDPACFGGCCNPMNVRAASSSGDVFTAESEGVVKRFSPAGEFRGVVGTVKIGGGCKNVAIGASADGDKVYFCDQPGSRFFILAKKPAAAETKTDSKNQK